MPKRDMKAALGASIKAEEKAVRNRFDKADEVFSRKPAGASSREASSDNKVIRDSFTMPEDDYNLITEIRHRCLKAGVTVNKSEAIRAGLNALRRMSDKELLAVMDRLAKVKTGRPPQSI
jgi:Arc/MetJ-type ribon-helix-helix transcriptional regulator